MHLKHLIRAGFRFAPFVQSPKGFLFETPGNTGATGSSSPGSSSSAAAATGGNNGSTTGTASPSSGTTGTAATAAASGSTSASTGTAPAGKSYTEAEYQKALTDARRGYVPEYRIVEETKKRTASEAAVAELNRKVRVMMGVDPNTGDDAETEKVKSAFFQMFGGQDGFVKAIFGVGVEDIRSQLANSRQAGDAVSHHWNQHRDQVLSTVADDIAGHLGVDSLTDRQRAKMDASFRLFVQNGVTADNEGFTRRYEAKDPTLIAEFVTEFVEDFVAPARRAATATVTRRPVPSGSGSRPVTTQQREEINAKTPEEAEEAGVKYLRSRGYFTGRDDGENARA